MIQELQTRRDALSSVIERAEGLHHDPTAQAKLLTSEGSDMALAVRERCDALELVVADAMWPLPKYREILFPV
jgi:glutamine synthetase